MRSYPGFTGVPSLRPPGGEDTADHTCGGLVTAVAGHSTEPPGTAQRFLLRPKAEVSTLKEM